MMAKKVPEKMGCFMYQAELHVVREWIHRGLNHPGAIHVVPAGGRSEERLFAPCWGMDGEGSDNRKWLLSGHEEFQTF